jgi:hypothetical protein
MLHHGLRWHVDSTLLVYPFIIVYFILEFF